MLRSLSPQKWAHRGRRGNMRKLAFFIPFLLMVTAKADLVSTGKMRPGCAEPGRGKAAVTTKLVAASKSAVYLNLAQTIKSQGVGNVHECRPLVYSAPPNNVAVPKTTITTTAVTTTAAVTRPPVYFQ